MTAILVIDVGTTSVRAAIVDERPASSRPWPADRSRRRRRSPGSSSSTPPSSPGSCSTPPHEAIAAAGEPVTAVGITNQRASTIVWDRATGEPIAPALGWQDLRTVGECIDGQGRARPRAGARTSRPPSWRGCSPTRPGAARPRPRASAPSTRWLAWSLSGGARARHRPLERRRHRPPRPSTAAAWNDARARGCSASRPRCCRASSTRAASSATATALPGRAADRRARRRPAGLARRPGLRDARAGPRSRSAPAACSTSARGAGAPASARRGDHGTFPIVAWSRGGEVTWGVEAIMLVGRHERRLAARRPRPDRHGGRQPRRGRRRCDDDRRRRLRAGAARARHAALGLRRPRHAARPDPGHDARPRRAGRARGRRPPRRRPRRGGRGRHRAARSTTLRVDGGMSANPTFTQALADATGRPVEVSPVVEATTLGAALPRRPGDRRVGRHRRRRPRLDAGAGRRARRRRSTARRGRGPSNGPPVGSPSCRPSTS